MSILFMILFSSLECGIKPIPPIGCSSENAVCVCDESEECEWKFVC